MWIKKNGTENQQVPGLNLWSYFYTGLTTDSIHPCWSIPKKVDFPHRGNILTEMPTLRHPIRTKVLLISHEMSWSIVVSENCFQCMVNYSGESKQNLEWTTSWQPHCKVDDLVRIFTSQTSVVPAGLVCKAFRKLKEVGNAWVRILCVARSDKLLAPDKNLEGYIMILRYQVIGISSLIYMYMYSKSLKLDSKSQNYVSSFLHKLQHTIDESWM